MKLSRFWNFKRVTKVHKGIILVSSWWSSWISIFKPFDINVSQHEPIQMSHFISKSVTRIQEFSRILPVVLSWGLFKTKLGRVVTNIGQIKFIRGRCSDWFRICSKWIFESSFYNGRCLSWNSCHMTLGQTKKLIQVKLRSYG